MKKRNSAVRINPKPSKQVLRLLYSIFEQPNNRFFFQYSSLVGWNEAKRYGWVERRVNTAVLTPTGLSVLNKYGYPQTNPRFDAPRKAAIQKWYAIIAYNGTQLLARVVSSFDKKSKANNYAKDLIGKTYKGHLITTVVLEGPFKSMTSANNVQVVLPPA